MAHRRCRRIGRLRLAHAGWRHDPRAVAADSASPRACERPRVQFRGRCDVVLQPILLARSKPRGPEIVLVRSLEEIYPRYREMFATMYRSALGTGLPIHDRSDMFAQSAEPYFFDVAHINEAGNRYAAERIAEVVVRGIPTGEQ